MKISFKLKVIFTIALIIIVIFTTMCIYFTTARVKELRYEIVNNAEMFVKLSYDKIGDAFLSYYRNAFFKFRSIIYGQKSLNRDLKNIQIVDLQSRIHYDMERYENGLFSFSEIKSITDEFVFNNLKKMEVITQINENDHVCIIAPYIDDYGVHNYSIVYYFSLARLKSELLKVLSQSIIIALLTILIGVVLAVFASNRITSHLKTLGEGAKKIAEGDFNRMINIKTGDEFEDLANAFNFMVEKIRENIRELNNLIKELEKRDTQKTQFLANISHELRTPLTASIGYIDYLKKEKFGSLNEEQKHSLDVVWRNLERLNKEIHSLLLVSKYSLEGIRLQPEEFEIEEMMDNTLSNFEPEIRLKRLSIKKGFRAKKIYADKENLRTVLENLISNSIKFADPKTQIEITTDSVINEKQKVFQLKISNKGVEIPKESLEKIFEPFYQIDIATSRKYGGIGLGLSIARNIIEAHQGRIWAESKEGTTTFYFVIPLRRAE